MTTQTVTESYRPLAHATTGSHTGHRLGARRVGLSRRPLPWARGVWWSVTLVVNGSMLAATARLGDVADHAVEASLIDFCIAIAARHDGVVRGGFVLGRSLRSYRLHLLTHHLGQLHRAMAIAGTVWFALALALAATSDDAGRAIGAAAMAILLAMMWTARDRTRHARHDLFEVVHRYGGWTALALLTALVLRQAASSAPAEAGIPVFLLLALIALVVHPWLGVKRLPAEIVTVTDQVVVVALPGRRSRGEFVRVSLDGREWHCFAVATTGSEGAGRYCLVIRRAGDWTERLARLRPTHMLVRRMRGYGFMHDAQAYRRVLIVATGAGIGPVLPYLLEPTRVQLDCLWIGRDHRAAVGDELVDRVLAGGQVRLIDTSHRRPDVGALVAAHARHFEAVFVVSNVKVRDEVARVCEHLGVPWYGPTFDS
jgi:predicted ferric reductase